MSAQVNINQQAMLSQMAAKSHATAGAGGEFGWEQPFPSIFEIMDGAMGMTKGSFSVVSEGLSSVCQNLNPKSPMTGISFQGVQIVSPPPGIHPANGLPGWWKAK